MFRKTLAAASLIAATTLFTVAPVRADNTKAESQRADRAAQVLNQFVNMPEKGIPKELLENAQGIAVIPHVVKAAFGVGGKYGKGLMTRRTKDGQWTAPAFVQITGGSYGFQIGGEATDVVLIFTNRQGIESLLSGKVTLGVGASVAAGPVGRSGQANTDIQMKAAIYSYSRSKGLFAGVSLKGAVLSIDNDADHAVYGNNVSGTDILMKQTVATNNVVHPFMKAVQSDVPTQTKRAE